MARQLQPVAGDHSNGRTSIFHGPLRAQVPISIPRRLNRHGPVPMLIGHDLPGVATSDVMSQTIAARQSATTHSGRRSRSTCGVPKPQNVGQGERAISAVAGVALLATGLARGRLSGLMLALAGGGLLYRGWTGHCQAFQAFGINTASHPDATVIPAQSGTKVERSMTINRPAQDLFDRWRDLEKLPEIMRHLKSVDVHDAQRSSWTADGPLGMSVTWEAEIFNERAPELIAWRSLPGSQIETVGSVRFQELQNGRGTVVTISLKYDPPGGKAGATLAWLLGSGAEQEIDEDLRRFKSRMETGEVPTIEGQSCG